MQFSDFKFEISSSRVEASTDTINRWFIDINGETTIITDGGAYISRFTEKDLFEIFLMDALQNNHDLIQSIYVEDDVLNIAIAIPYPVAKICFQLFRIIVDDATRIEYFIAENKRLKEELKDTIHCLEVSGLPSRVVVHTLTNEDINDRFYRLYTSTEEQHILKHGATNYKRQYGERVVYRRSTDATTDRSDIATLDDMRFMHLFDNIHEVRTAGQITNGGRQYSHSTTITVRDIHPPQMLLYVDSANVVCRIEFRAVVLKHKCDNPQTRGNINSSSLKENEKWILRIPEYIYSSYTFPLAVSCGSSPNISSSECGWCTIYDGLMYGFSLTDEYITLPGTTNWFINYGYRYVGSNIEHSQKLMPA